MQSTFDIPFQQINFARSALSRVELVRKGDNYNVVMTLTGHEMALAADQGKLDLQQHKNDIGFLLVERGQDKKSLVITASANSDAKHLTPEDKALQVVDAIHAMTECRLGYITLRPEVVISSAAGRNEQHYTSAVTVTPNHDRSDPHNKAGYFAVNLIRKLFTSGAESTGHIVTDTTNVMKDPTNGLLVPDRGYAGKGLRLLNVMKACGSEREAQMDAERRVNSLEREFSVFYPKTMHLMLMGLRTEPMTDGTHKKMGKYLHKKLVDELTKFETKESHAVDPMPFVTTATLYGSEEDVERAERTLAYSFPSKVFRMHRDGEMLEVMLAGDNHADPARLVAAIQSKTQCTLPMDIHADTTDSYCTPKHFSPCLETEVWDDVPKAQRGQTANALAGYVGLQFPNYSLTVPERGTKTQELLKSRVVVHEPRPTKDEAQTAAEDYKNGVEARLRRSSSPRLS